MLVFKSLRRSSVVAVLLAGLAACSEGPTAPSSAVVDTDPLMAKGKSGGGSSGSGSQNSGRGLESGTRTFTIWPGVPVFEKFGEHVLQMPANVVCDPARSAYGAEHWDTPCARANQPIQVTATWGERNGRPVIAFSPDLRFAPSSDESKWVNLSLRASKTLKPDLYYTILWYDPVAKRWVDESETDPTLKAHPSNVGNFVTRRLKHFSGYALWAGFGSYNVTSGYGGDIYGIGGW